MPLLSRIKPKRLRCDRAPRWALLGTLVTSLASPAAANAAEAPRVKLVTVPVALGAGAEVTDRKLRVRAIDAGIERRGPGATVCAPFAFTAFALRWRNGPSGEVTARVRSAIESGAWSRSYELVSDPAEGPDASSAEWHAKMRATDLLWTGRARCVRLALDLPPGARIEDPKAVFIDSSGDPPSSGVRTERSSVKRPEIVTREMWGARESLRNCPPAYARKLKAGFVHHTAGSNRYTRAQSDDVLRAIYHYHTRIRGWCDIGYNFLVDKYGTVFEGRAGGIDRPVVPAAQQGFNRGAFAVSAIGNFEERAPWAATISALQHVLAWRLDVAHLPARGRARMISTGGPHTRYPAGTEVRLRVVNGHRRTGLTACPGDKLSRLIRDIRVAAARIGGPKILRPRSSSPSLRAGSDKVVLRARSNRRLDWTVTIASSEEAVRTFESVGRRVRFGWRGTYRSGDPVGPGRYVVRIMGQTSQGKEARPARLRLNVTD